ncbi:hypothetical protein [Paenibacillus paridis]|uniref:hypothetical protein n=1 Tax=Paenibacillus paridis TaxID=2583376 RepID=UPI00111E3112|nr:hypothetical protein [Paenibacillus paridis]
MKKLSLFVIIAVVAFLALTYAVVSANKKADEKNPTSDQVTATPEPVSTASDAVQPQAQTEELVVVKENPVEAAGAVHTTQEQAEPVKETTAAIVQEVKPEPSTAPAVKKDTQNQVKPNAAGTAANKAEEEKPQASTAPAVSAPANQTGTGTPKVSSPAATEKPVQETKIATKEDTQPATAAPAVKEESKKSITFTKKEEVKVVTPAVTPSSSSSSSSASEEFCEEGC